MNIDQFVFSLALFSNSPKVSQIARRIRLPGTFQAHKPSVHEAMFHVECLNNYDNHFYNNNNDDHNNNSNNNKNNNNNDNNASFLNNDGNNDK